jgi:hypothetical protein
VESNEVYYAQVPLTNELMHMPPHVQSNENLPLSIQGQVAEAQLPGDIVPSACSNPPEQPIKETTKERKTRKFKEKKARKRQEKAAMRQVKAPSYETRAPTTDSVIPSVSDSRSPEKVEATPDNQGAPPSARPPSGPVRFERPMPPIREQEEITDPSQGKAKNPVEFPALGLNAGWVCCQARPSGKKN